jgi:chromosome condensin MukBEF ATPase and DNA-binding subunit MukB
VYEFGHLGEMLKEVAVLATPHTLEEHSSILNLVKEFRRQQDVVNLLRLRAVGWRHSRGGTWPSQPRGNKLERVPAVLERQLGVLLSPYERSVIDDPPFFSISARG